MTSAAGSPPMSSSATPWRGRPTSVCGATSLNGSLLGDRRDAVDPRVGRACAASFDRRCAVVRALLSDGVATLTTLDPAGGEIVEHRCRDRAVGDVGRLELEHRRRVAARVDREPQRHAVDRVPRELERAEQAAVVLGRDADRVGGLSGDVAGDRARQVHALGEPGRSSDWIRAIVGIAVVGRWRAWRARCDAGSVPL